MPDRSERADVFLVSHGFAASRAEAQAAIQAGRVEADGQKVTKAAQKLRESMTIQYEAAHPYVSRGGVKLAAALDHFALSPEGRVCLDLGASTGDSPKSFWNAAPRTSTRSMSAMTNCTRSCAPIRA